MREPSLRQIRAQMDFDLRHQAVELRRQIDDRKKRLKYAIGFDSATIQRELVFIEDRLRRLQRERAELL